MTRRIAAAAALAAAVLLAAGDEAAAKGGQVLVSAAVSLTDVLQQLAPLYAKRTGDRIVLNLAASNTLAQQIRFGAPVDLFISADETQMNAVSAQIVGGSRVDLLANQLAIAVPDDRARTFTSARDLAEPAIKRIAIGDPAAVPAGVYAKQYLDSLGLWSQLQPKMAPAGSVRLALEAVESGAADAAIVYRTDIAASAHAREAFVVPAADGPRIVYPAAIVRSGRNQAGARQVLDFLRGPDAAAVFMHAGFLAPAAAAH